GADRLRTIDDPHIRNSLTTIMTLDFDNLDYTAVDTPYRQNVRRIIPEPVQQAIRQRCGDRTLPDKPLVTVLPRSCNLQLPADEARRIAALLRARPQLADDLRWHLAAEAGFLANLDIMEAQTRGLPERIDHIE